MEIGRYVVYSGILSKIEVGLTKVVHYLDCYFLTNKFILEQMKLRLKFNINKINDNEYEIISKNETDFIVFKVIFYINSFKRWEFKISEIYLIDEYGEYIKNIDDEIILWKNLIIIQ